MDAAPPPASAGPVSTDPPTRIVMIPSVSGGIGHISRTAALTRALQRFDTQVEVEFLLDADWLRPLNIVVLEVAARRRALPGAPAGGLAG